MCLSFGKQLVDIDSLHFSNELMYLELVRIIYNLVRNLEKNDSHYVNQEFNDNVLMY